MTGVTEEEPLTVTLPVAPLDSNAAATTIAMDGIAVVVNLDNPTANLTSDQVKGVYVGDITSWDELAE